MWRANLGNALKTMGENLQAQSMMDLVHCRDVADDCSKCDIKTIETRHRAKKASAPHSESQFQEMFVLEPTAYVRKTVDETSR
jgi:hypothetical protein